MRFRLLEFMLLEVNHFCKIVLLTDLKNYLKNSKIIIVADQNKVKENGLIS